VIHEDGSNLVALPDSLETISRADWSPDGTRLVFARIISVTGGTGGTGVGVLAIVNADGSGYTEVPNTRARAFDLSRPSWSPDGTSIAFAKYVAGLNDIYVVKVDGSGLKNISNAGGMDTGPDWGP
jgi:TolB protein